MSDQVVEMDIGVGGAPHNLEIGSVLRRERRYQELSIYDIGKRIGVSGAQVSAWETATRGRTAPLERFLKWLDALGLNPIRHGHYVYFTIRDTKYDVYVRFLSPRPITRGEER